MNPAKMRMGSSESESAAMGLGVGLVVSMSASMKSEMVTGGGEMGRVGASMSGKSRGTESKIRELDAEVTDGSSLDILTRDVLRGWLTSRVIVARVALIGTLVGIADSPLFVLELVGVGRKASY